MDVSETGKTRATTRKEDSSATTSPQGSRMTDIREISAPALAYLGDCVLELCVRRHLVESGLSTSAHLNAAALDFVRAPAQAEAMKRLLPHLTEEETAYFRRGRNIGHTNVPRRATVGEYRAATGMEVLFGYLYLTGQSARLCELFRVGYPAAGNAAAEDGGTASPDATAADDTTESQKGYQKT